MGYYADILGTLRPSFKVQAVAASGLITSTSPEVLRLASVAGFLSGYNAAQTVRTGYLQFNSGGNVLLRAEQTNNLLLQTVGGSLSIDTGGDAAFAGGKLGIGKTLGSLTDVLDVVSAGRAYLVLTGGGVGTTSGINMTATAGPAGFSIDIGAGSTNNFRIQDTINGAERFRIDNAGNVGINSATPQAYGASYMTLEVKGGTTSTGGVIQSVSSDSSVKVRLFVDSGLGVVGTSTANALLVQTNGVERARFDTSGQLGIGVTPSFTLDVQAASAKIVATSTTGTNVAYLRATNTGGSFYLGMDSSIGSITGSAYAAMVWELGGTAPMVFGLGSGERMRIDPAGNVGIGNTPQSWNASFDALEVGPSGGAALMAGVNNSFLLTNTYYNAAGSWVRTTANPVAIYEQTGGAHIWFGDVTGTAASTYTPTERMRLDAAGRVGIGMAPSGLFDVAGTVRALGASTATTGSSVELEFTGATGYLTAYNRTGAAWLPLIVRGSTLAFQIAGTAALSIDASRNVGIGVVPQAWNTAYKALEIGASGGGALWAAPGNTVLSTNTYYNATPSWARTLTGVTMAYQQTGGVHAWLSDATGAAGAYTPTERMRLDASGNLGIGTVPGGSAKLEVVLATAIHALLRSTTASGYTSLRLYNDQNSATRSLEIDYTGSTYSGGEMAILATTGAFPLTFATNNVERMRVDSAGNVGIGNTPRAWNSAYKALEIGASGGGTLWGASADFYISSNSYYSSTPAWTRINTAATSSYRQNAGTHSWFTDASGTAGTTFTPTQRMSISAAGAVSIVGALGINSKTPVANVAAPPAATVLADTITLVNDIRTRLINFGIYT